MEKNLNNRFSVNIFSFISFMLFVSSNLLNYYRLNIFSQSPTINDCVMCSLQPADITLDILSGDAQLGLNYRHISFT